MPDDHQTIQREILRRVADGELAPNDAAELLTELDRQRTGGPSSAAGGPSGGAGAPGAGSHTTPQSGPGGRVTDDGGGVGDGGDGGVGDGGTSNAGGSARGRPAGADAGSRRRDDEAAAALKTVRLSATFRTMQVVGDPTVAEAVVVDGGQHTVRRSGDVLIIDVDNEEESNDGYSFAGRTGARARLWAVGVGQRRLRPVVIRMNPTLALDAELGAGTMSVVGVRGAIRARVSAGSLRVEDFAAPLDIAVSAGSVSAQGVLDRGESTIECDAGKVRLVLLRGSSVRVQARADLGKVDIHGAGDEGSSEWLLGGGHDATVGAGEATLKIRASMGSVQVVAP